MRGHATLDIEPRPSRILLVSGSSVHLLSGVAVVVCSLPLWIKAGLFAGITLALIRFGWQYGYRRGRGFIARVELVDGRWRLATGDGGQHQIRAISGYAHPRIVILNFRLEDGQRRSLVLLPDSADPDVLRELRVWLRTRRDKEGADRP